MQLEIHHENYSIKNKFCLCVAGGQFIYDSSEDVMNFLNINKEDYRQIMLKNRAKPTILRFYFSKIEDAENALNDLEPYLIMRKLL